jgi:hypothetical protein
MPPHPRAGMGATQPFALGTGDSHASGRGRQRLKLAALGYFNSRHGMDADESFVAAARKLLRRLAVEFAETLTNVRYRDENGNDEMLCVAAIAYATSRHGIDADVGMAKEGMGMLCQAAIDFCESLPREEPLPKRSTELPHPHHQLGNGASR